MDGRTEIGAVKEDLEGLTVSELVTLLKSAFENAYFTLVEEVLVSREEKLKAEMEGKNRENELLLEKLQRFKKESREMKELVTRLKEERDVLLNIMKENEDDKKEIIELKRKNCELECAKLNAETELDVYRGTIKEDRDELLKRTRENGDLKKEIIELKRKNCDLECAELNAETEMGVNKGILKGINERLLSLEKDLGMVRTLEEVDVTIEDPFVNLPLDTNAVEEETKMFDSAEKLLSETNPNPSRGSSHRKRTASELTSTGTTYP
ncbi:protein CROWDED NUCLEI 2-like isoform X2 [Euphorbia lathyris]|uniref:protein CROWDED NUCLEI 2-like isoform X2 n=1 Tax=Euphorbia lathyris TaxID=212925 RepID=UPI003313DBA7